VHHRPSTVTPYFNSLAVGGHQPGCRCRRCCWPGAPSRNDPGTAGAGAPTLHSTLQTRNHWTL